MDAWKKAKDIVPDTDRQVLVLFASADDSRIVEVMRFAPFFGKGRNGVGTWVDADGDQSTSHGMAEFPITHWCEIPTLPAVDPDYEQAVNSSSLYPEDLAQLHLPR